MAHTAHEFNRQSESGGDIVYGNRLLSVVGSRNHVTYGGSSPPIEPGRVITESCLISTECPADGLGESLHISLSRDTRRKPGHGVPIDVRGLLDIGVDSI